MLNREVENFDVLKARSLSLFLDSSSKSLSSFPVFLSDLFPKKDFDKEQPRQKCMISLTEEVEEVSSLTPSVPASVSSPAVSSSSSQSKDKSLPVYQGINNRGIKIATTAKHYIFMDKSEPNRVCITVSVNLKWYVIYHEMIRFC